MDIIDKFLGRKKKEEKSEAIASELKVEKLEAKADIKGLIEALSYKDSTVRWRAAEALGKIGDKRAGEPLIHALRDENSTVRQRAAAALGKIGDPKAVEPLMIALKDEYSYVREETAKALKNMALLLF